MHTRHPKRAEPIQNNAWKINFQPSLSKCFGTVLRNIFFFWNIIFPCALDGRDGMSDGGSDRFFNLFTHTRYVYGTRATHSICDMMTQFKIFSIRTLFEHIYGNIYHSTFRQANGIWIYANTYSFVSFPQFSNGNYLPAVACDVQFVSTLILDMY